MNWSKHVVRASDHAVCSDDEPDPEKHRERIEPWLSALFQAEHLNLLVGSGLTIAIAEAARAQRVDMSPQIDPMISSPSMYVEEIAKAAQESARRLGRGKANIEDEVRAIIDLIGGLRVLATGPDASSRVDPFHQTTSQALSEWESELDSILSSLLKRILETERGIGTALIGADVSKSAQVRNLLGGFLLSFASRAATRERAHIFTLNYDRLIEYGCDLLGLRIVDRFVGSLAPVFHSSRLGIDLHYNPPGIRGEPRYLEGVVQLTKLHGSVDWRSLPGPSGGPEVQRAALPFGAAENHPGLPQKAGDRLLIYPNPAKDVETLEYPYAELFRDFAAAVCRPNSVVVTFGYGFGDDHVNRVLRDMLSIPSTHLVVMSFDKADGRLPAFCDKGGREAQISLLVGPHFGDLGNLVEHYLPKSAIDRTTWRMVELLNRRQRPDGGGATRTDEEQDNDGESSA